MITEKGKEYIARNLGVNNCYALEEVVPCTVYTDGTPNVRTLDTSTILFVLVSEVAEKVKTAAGTFTLADLIAANDGSYISMTNALDIEAYCIPGAPPATPPVTPPVTPLVTPPVTPTAPTKEIEIVAPVVNCDSRYCYVNLKIKNNTASASVYVRVEVDGTQRFKRYAYIVKGATREHGTTIPFRGISSGYHNLTIAVGKVADTDTYTHRFLVGAPGIEPPVTPPVTPPYTPPVTGVPEAIKAWIVANYGDGTRVTSGGWLKLYDANMANNLAPLPAGYTKASITEGVVQWAKANPNWEIQTICGWISAIGVTNLTEDHGRYIHSLAIGWTTLANDFYDKLSPKPSKPPSAIVTEDNGRGVYGYAIGWNTLANEFTGCNF